MTPTSFNMAAAITDGGNTAAFEYDPDHARYAMVITGLNAGTTYYLNDPSSGAMEEKSIVGGATTWNDYIKADGQLVAERSCVGAAPCTAAPQVNYFILDHLGSVAVIVSSAGAVLNRLSYDAWGKRRNPDGTAINCTAGTSPPSSVTRGFTGQEMLDGLCLINFNARIYDPSLGRFMAPDPIVGDETVPQELNRYSYVLNDPLSLTDPSGLCGVSCIFGDIFEVVFAFVLVQPEFLPALGADLGFTTTNAALALVVNAGIAGGISTYIVTGSLKGAALAALQAGLFAEAGNLLQTAGSGGFFGTGHVASAFVAHGLVGGLVSEIGQGRFGSGFLAGGIGSLTPVPAGGQNWEQTVEGAVESAALGGVGSVLGGGKFEDGAITGAFGYLFNYCAHNGCFKGKFTLRQAIDQWQHGNGQSVTQVDASQIELGGATYTPLSNGDYVVHTSIFTDTGRVFGSIVMFPNADGTFSFKPDVYDFDQKNPLAGGSLGEDTRLIFRDAGTLAGQLVNGSGTPFKIQIAGSIPRPAGLPK